MITMWCNSRESPTDPTYDNVCYFLGKLCMTNARDVTKCI